LIACTNHIFFANASQGLKKENPNAIVALEKKVERILTNKFSQKKTNETASNGKQ